VLLTVAVVVLGGGRLLPDRTPEHLGDLAPDPRAHAQLLRSSSRPPAAAAASETTMFTGVPVRVSSDPALAANASGISIFEGTSPARTATTTTTGSRCSS
jgi:hypothetical protein